MATKMYPNYATKKEHQKNGTYQGNSPYFTNIPEYQYLKDLRTYSHLKDLRPTNKHERQNNETPDIGDLG